MVYLSRIYTKTGDGGETSLGGGSRVAKDHPRVAAYGSVDELNAVLGLLLADQGQTPELTVHAELLRGIQNDLFDVGSDLCRPQTSNEPQALAPPNEPEALATGLPPKKSPLRVRPEQVARLEAAIDRLNANLRPLRSFVLPGGSPAAARCHLARTVCRRAERAVVTLMRSEPINVQALIYLNRLSDLLFVLARVCNETGPGETLWVPGGTNQKG